MSRYKIINISSTQINDKYSEKEWDFYGYRRINV